MWNLKHDTNEHIYETDTDSQTHRTDLWLPRGRGVAEGWIGSLGLADANYYKLLYTEWINKKVLLYSTWNYIHYVLSCDKP